MAAHGAGQDLGVWTELGHPCRRCAPSTEIQECALDPTAPQSLDSLGAQAVIPAQASAGEPSPR